MPGYDINRFVGLTQSEKFEFICSICHEILRCPVVTNCCFQLFCTDCINDWIKTNNNCPFDRKRLTKDQLLNVPRAMINILGKLNIRCEFQDLGCNKIVELENLSNHIQQCQYNYMIKECVKCLCKNCLKNHDCVEYLLDTNNKIIIEANQLRESNITLMDNCFEMTTELNKLKISYGKIYETNRSLILERNQLKSMQVHFIEKDTSSRYASSFNYSLNILLQQIEELKVKIENMFKTFSDFPENFLIKPNSNVSNLVENDAPIFPEWFWK